MPDSFSYRQFSVDNDRRTVSFDYLLTHDGQTHELSERLVFPIGLQDTPEQQASLRALHMALGISYYKTFLPAIIDHPYKMDAHEANFWNDVWRNGLGEFLYVNRLSPERLAHFTAQDGTSYAFNGAKATSGQDVLLGLGGGKDSIVAGETLKQLGLPVDDFVMATGEQLGQTQTVADVMNIHLHVIERTLDKQLLTLQELPDAYKGHVPISLIFGLVGSALAVALDKKYVVVANEASASIPRHASEHGDVNHQWSKSLEFERQLQTYIRRQIAPHVTYFSAIRELTSVAVAKLFAHYPAYFEVFTSDNFVFRIDPAKRPSGRWSLESPKSLSSFILLAPWLSEADLLKVFGRNFLNEQTLEALFLESTGQQGKPPLDCVGTVDELVLSLNLAFQQGKFVDSYLVKLARVKNVIAEKDWQAILQPMLALQPEQALPVELQSALEAQLQSGLSS